MDLDFENPVIMMNGKMHWMALLLFLSAPVLPSASSGASLQTAPRMELPLPGEVFLVDRHTAFIIPAKANSARTSKPWVWYAPTLPGLPGKEEQWMFDQFLDAGIAIAGIDVGESFGSPAGRKFFTTFHAEMTGQRGYSPKPVLLGRSRGGLMTLSWAAENPDKVAGFAGIYPVCNVASYPGVTKAAGAYEMKPEELEAHLTEHNPIDRLVSLARAGVPLFAIHGDVDTVVPLEANSGLVKERYTALGGSMQLIVPPGQGHNMWPGFFQNQELVNFVKAHAGPNITLFSPLDYQVIQRSSRTKGFMIISGEFAGSTAKSLTENVGQASSLPVHGASSPRVSGGRMPPEPADKMSAPHFLTRSRTLTFEARLIVNGQPGKWRRLRFNSKRRSFEARWDAPAGGWHRLEIRALSGAGVLAESVIEHVGVGEVFAIAGQSNSANHGAEKQNPKTGLVAAFDGKRWRPAHDPQPGASGGGGSFIPPFGDAIAARFHVPVGIVACGVGATSVREWLPKGARFPNPPTLLGHVQQLPGGEWESRGSIFAAFSARMKQLGPHGFRAVLWHQGESDANQVDPTRTLPGKLYREYLEKLIRASRREIGWNAPWFVAQASYHVPGDEASPDIRAAQASLWKDGIALEGPDSDALKGDLRDNGGKGVHFSGPGLREHAARWVEKVAPWLERTTKQTDLAKSVF